MTDRIQPPVRLALVEVPTESSTETRPVSLLGARNGGRVAARLSHVFVPGAEAPPVGAVITLDLQVAEGVTLEVRAEVTAVGELAEGVGMHVTPVSPSGNRASLPMLSQMGRTLSGEEPLPDDLDDPARGMRGELSHVSLPSLLLLLEMERRTGVLHLVRGEDRGRLLLRGGLVVGCELEAEEVPDDFPARVHRLLDWESGAFELELGEVTESADGGFSSTHLLLEHARLKDEAE